MPMTIELQEEFFRLVEYVPISILIRQKDTWVYSNQTAIRLIGASSKEEIIGTSIAFFNGALQDEWNGRCDGSERNCGGLLLNAVETILTRLDGSTLDVEVTAIEAVFLGEGVASYAITDLTELKLGRQLLLQSETLTALGELAAGIAHEIRNPLTSLRGFIQLAQRDQENKKQYFSIMLSELDRIHLIVNELLLLAKPRALSFSQESLQELLESITTLTSTQAILHNVQIKVEYRNATEH